MENELNKLIAAYEQKITDCEALIDNLELNKKHLSSDNSLDFSLYDEQVKVKNAELRAYIKIRIDLENLLKRL